MTNTVRRAVVIRNRLGMHARAASTFVQQASDFKAEVWVQRDDQRVNGKSIMGVLMLAASMGTEITIEAIGNDAEAAVTALATLVESKFGEAE